MSMKNKNCCGDNLSCDIPTELPDNYIDTLYAMYQEECKKSNKEPKSKPEWIKTLTE